MKVLAIETSSQMGSVALDQHSHCWLREKSHSEFVTFQTEKILKDHGLTSNTVDAFAVGIGPGSFTGIRVGVNLIRALAFAESKPVFTCNSLLIQAWPALQQQSLPVLALVNAFKNLVFYAIYQMRDHTLVEVAAPTVISPEKLSDIISTPHLVVGDGFGIYHSQFVQDLLPNLQRDSRFQDYPVAKSLVELSTRAELKSHFLLWNQVVPLYIRRSEAEEKLDKRLFK